MKNTRLMDRLFSATDEKDQELTEQVANDIEAAKENGSVDTDELKYEHVGDGKVIITDKGNNNEQTVAEKAEDGNYDLYPAEVTPQIEGFIHPEGDGVTPGDQQGAPDEHVEDHLAPEAQVEEHVNPEAGSEPSVEVVAEEGREPRAEDAEDQVCPDCGKNPCECSKEDEEEKELSVSTDNSVVLRIFSDQEFCERLFSEVIESEETAKVGDLKVEKVGENEVVVTSEATGDQAKVCLDEDEMEVTELDSKTFSEEEGEEENYLPLRVVGVDPINHVIVDAPVYSNEDAEELVARLEEQDIDAVEVFDNDDAAREYAMNLLNGLDATDVDEEPTEATFSDTDKFDLYVTRFYSDNTVYMDRLFSEALNDVETSQEVIEGAIEAGEQVENDTEIVTPVDANTAVVEDKENNEFTKVTLNNGELHARPIGESEAEELTAHLEVDSVGAGNKSDEARVEEGREEAKEFSESVMERYFSDTEDEVYCDNEETKFFSESEEMTDYMVRLFSEESDSEKIEEAIKDGEKIEGEKETIIPVSEDAAVIEDKENGEWTKAELKDEEIELHPIAEEEAKELIADEAAAEEEAKAEEPKAEEAKEDEAPAEEPKAEEEKKEDEKEFSTIDKFFAEAGIVAPQAPAAPATAEFVVDENGNPVQPVEAPAEAVMTPEAIEDKALAAVQSIQAAAAEAEAQILNAKAAPVEGAGQDLQEAHFSETEKTFSENNNDTFISWLGNVRK